MQKWVEIKQGKIISYVCFTDQVNCVVVKRPTEEGMDGWTDDDEVLMSIIRFKWNESWNVPNKESEK